MLDPSGQGQGRYGIPPAFSGANAGKPNNTLSLPRRWAVGQWFAAPTVQIAYSDGPEIDRNPSTARTTSPRSRTIADPPPAPSPSAPVSPSALGMSPQRVRPADAPDPGPPNALYEVLPHDPSHAQRFAHPMPP